MTEDDGWKLVYREFIPGEERLREALCTVGNGFFATRGAAPEAVANRDHYPGTYICGCYNRLQTDVDGTLIENESLVNAPNWLPLGFRIEDGGWFELREVEILDYRQELDLRSAVLGRHVRFRDREGRVTRLDQRRLASMVSPHIAALETLIQAENWEGRIELRCGLDGNVINSGVERYNQLNNRHLDHITARSDSGNSFSLEVKTSQSHIRIAQAARVRVYAGNDCLDLKPEIEQADGSIAHSYHCRIDPDTPLRVDKTVAIYTSRDLAISEAGIEARKTVADSPGFPVLAERHSLRWQQLWERFDLDIDHVDQAQEEKTRKILRLHLLQLIQTTSPHVIEYDVSVPARGLHGEAYRGHIFWDELFVFPLFNLRMPEITRSLLRYRYRRLDEARRAARSSGYQGAMYPWQSGSNGREESQYLHLNPESGRWLPDNTYLQRHINAAVVYNIWQYYQVSRDMEFMSFYGAEMILEIARFWASIVSFNDDLGRYEIHNVMGPDEYHDRYPGSEEPGLRNNTYTNVMAVWVLLRALDLLEILPRHRLEGLCQSLRITADEFDRWQDISRRMRIVLHADGIISQFEGYENLQEFDWQAYREKYDNIQRLDRLLEAEGDTPNRYKVSKQADVLMLFYLFSAEELRELFTHLGYPFEYDTIPKNIDYYLQRTSHGSTLSQIVHSWVLARLDRPESWMLFMNALESDIGDIQGGTTQEGVHIGAMAGTVDLVQRCFTGIEARGDVLWLNPRLPEGLNRLELNVCYRHHLLWLQITPTCVRISSEKSSEQPIDIGINSQIHRIEPGGVDAFAI